MITSIEGTIAGTGLEWVDVTVGGVTLRANVPQSAVERIGHVGDMLRLATSLQVRDDSLTLYGFPTEEGRSAFEALVGVNGVGPRVALSILSSLTSEALARAVAAGDMTALKAVPGVGAKTANRIVLELTGKLDVVSATAVDGQADSEVFEALTALGYSASEAMAAIASLEPGAPASLEERVRLCLERMGGR